MNRCTKAPKKSVFLVVVLLISIFTACFGFYILRHSQTAEPTLRFVSILHRHGERSPEATYPLDPYKGESFWPEGLGILLQRGKIGLYELGRFFRRRYDGFLSAKYSPDETSVTASYFDRCIMSASLLLAGLYPPVGIQLWNPDLKWQPIPVHATPFECDSMIIVQKPCALLSEEYVQWKAVLEKKLEGNQEFLTNLSRNTGLNVETMDDVYYIYDNIMIVEEQGLTLPEWVEGVREKLYSFGKVRALEFFMSPTMRKLLSGVLINNILSNMKKKTDTKEAFERRLNLYSAHDSTLARVWRAMNIAGEITERPPYGAALIFELHDINGKYRVKILYKGSYFDENLTVMKINGCNYDTASKQDEMCDFDTFTAALQDAAIDDFEKACQVSGNANS